MGILKDALVAQQPRQERRLRATVMLVDSVLKKRWRQKRKAEKSTVHLFCENRCSHQPQRRRQQLQPRRQRQTAAAASADPVGSKHAGAPVSSIELDLERSTATRSAEVRTPEMPQLTSKRKVEPKDRQGLRNTLAKKWRARVPRALPRCGTARGQSREMDRNLGPSGDQPE